MIASICGSLHRIMTSRARAGAAASVDISKVFIATPYLGGGFGRKGRGEIVVQAVLASKAVAGKPVKVMWSREDETVQGAYRPAMAARFRGGLDAAWSSHRTRHAFVGPADGPRIQTCEVRKQCRSSHHRKPDQQQVSDRKSAPGTHGGECSSAALALALGVELAERIFWRASSTNWRTPPARIPSRSAGIIWQDKWHLAVLDKVAEMSK